MALIASKMRGGIDTIERMISTTTLNWMPLRGDAPWSSSRKNRQVQVMPSRNPSEMRLHALDNFLKALCSPASVGFFMINRTCGAATGYRGAFFGVGVEG